jgi:hypothetical protein
MARRDGLIYAVISEVILLHATRVRKVIKIPGVLTEAGSLFVLVAGTGFEPATSGL